MAKVDLELIRTFNVIYETRSLTRAAVELSVTQPSVSYSLARLRKQLDDPLFVRGAEGMEPTARATELFRVFKRTVSEIDAAVDTFDPEKSDRTFRLCLSDLGEIAFLPAVADLIRREATGVTLEVVPMQIQFVVEWLERGQIDAAIASVKFPELSHRELIADDRYVAVVPAGSAFTLPKMSLDEFLAARHVAIDQSTGHNQIETAIRSRGLERRVGLRLHHFSVLPNVLSAGELAAIVPLHVAEIFKSNWPIDIRELPFEIPAFSVNLYWQEKPRQSEAQKWFLDIISRAVPRVIH